MARKLTPGEYGWLGLVAYVSIADGILLAKRKEPMTDAWRRALSHTINRWVVIMAWAFTTKHLFFGNVMPKLDPFHAIVSIAKTLEKILGE